jgi:hypothetical protein
MIAVFTDSITWSILVSVGWLITIRTRIAPGVVKSG